MSEDIFGWTGKILRVDLSTGKIGREPTMAYADRFLGGVGIGMKILWAITLILLLFKPSIVQKGLVGLYGGTFNGDAGTVLWAVRDLYEGPRR